MTKLAILIGKEVQQHVFKAWWSL